MENFTWRDGERLIRFGRGAAADAGTLAGPHFTLLTTERAQDSVPGLADLATSVRFVPPGQIDTLAAELIEQVDEAPIVALGGGRIMDVAKAIGSVNGARVVAIPTTLSGAELSAGHRAPRGHPFRPLRPQVVVYDPALAASQPPAELAASAANALAHAIEGRVTINTSPVPSLAGEEAQRLIDIAFYGDDPADADRDKVALGAFLGGYCSGTAGIGMHHMLSQTLVRLGGASHAQSNAVLLPHTIGALERRNPGHVDPDGTLTELARKLARFAQAETIGALGVDEGKLDAIVAEAATREGLALTPPPADAAEIRQIYEAAW